ncbi:MAG: hypothetical protein H0V10_17825, partial [Geodermatophilaceae bacterium]|nr:hypothetical protein [Geodermatophilaceae bacterium]
SGGSGDGGFDDDELWLVVVLGPVVVGGGSVVGGCVVVGAVVVVSVVGSADVEVGEALVGSVVSVLAALLAGAVDDPGSEGPAAAPVAVASSSAVRTVARAGTSAWGCRRTPAVTTTAARRRRTFMTRPS